MFSEHLMSDSDFTFEEWCTNPFVQTLTTSDTLGWKDISIYTTHLEATRETAVGPLSENLFLNTVLEGTTQVHSLFNDAPYHEFRRPGSLDIHPAGFQSVGSWDMSVTVAFVQLSMRSITQLAESTFRGDPAQVQLRPQYNAHDSLIFHLITELCHEIQNPGPISTLFAESAAQTIMLQVLRKYSNISIRLHPLRARLTTRQLRCINDYIESNLDQKISLTELASLLFMSQSHFERLFRATMGCAPYRYVLDRKIERAKWLLVHSALTLQQVAEQCGFATQSHFTRHFTHQVGISPARFRDGFKD